MQSIEIGNEDDLALYDIPLSRTFSLNIRNFSVIDNISAIGYRVDCPLKFGTKPRRQVDESSIELEALMNAFIASYDDCTLPKQMKWNNGDHRLFCSLSHALVARVLTLRVTTIISFDKKEKQKMQTSREGPKSEPCSRFKKESFLNAKGHYC